MPCRGFGGVRADTFQVWASNAVPLPPTAYVWAAPLLPAGLSGEDAFLMADNHAVFMAQSMHCGWRTRHGLQWLLAWPRRDGRQDGNFGPHATARSAVQFTTYMLALRCMCCSLDWGGRKGCGRRVAGPAPSFCEPPPTSVGFAQNTVTVSAAHICSESCRVGTHAMHLRVLAFLGATALVPLACAAAAERCQSRRSFRRGAAEAAGPTAEAAGPTRAGPTSWGSLLAPLALAERSLAAALPP